MGEPSRWVQRRSVPGQGRLHSALERPCPAPAVGRQPRQPTTRAPSLRAWCACRWAWAGLQGCSAEGRAVGWASMQLRLCGNAEQRTADPAPEWVARECMDARAGEASHRAAGRARPGSGRPALPPAPRRPPAWHACAKGVQCPTRHPLHVFGRSRLARAALCTRTCAHKNARAPCRCSRPRHHQTPRRPRRRSPPARPPAWRPSGPPPPASAGAATWMG